jgi:predicted nucleic acid-binding protein
MIVLDASAVLELLLRSKRSAAVVRHIASEEETLHAPHLLDLEVAQVLRRFCTTEALDPQRAWTALRDLRDLDIERYAHEPMLERIWELRANVTAYDAAYLALAEALGARLLTCDARLARATGHRAHIELVVA